LADFGTDISTFVLQADGTYTPDLDPSFSLITGTRVVGEAIARRLMTPRGALLYDPDYGLDLRAYLNDDLDTRELYTLGALIEAEAEKDERVLSAVVDLSLDARSSRLTIRLTVTLLDAESYALTLAADAVTVTILRLD
jgi:hypothetical protein